jgi:hypothetical protein
MEQTVAKKDGTFVRHLVRREVYRLHSDESAIEDLDALFLVQDKPLATLLRMFRTASRQVVFGVTSVMPGAGDDGSEDSLGGFATVSDNYSSYLLTCISATCKALGQGLNKSMSDVRIEAMSQDRVDVLVHPVLYVLVVGYQNENVSLISRLTETKITAPRLSPGATLRAAIQIHGNRANATRASTMLKSCAEL